MSLIRRRTPVASVGDPDCPPAGGRRTTRLAHALVRGLLVVAAGTAALTLAGPLALRPFADVAGAAGEVSVAFVLDFGGSPGTVVSGCVSVPSTDNRYDALSAFTASRGLAAPVYAPSGLLCSINGTPGSGCGQTVPGGYIYWSYFTGESGTWNYASTGAFGTVTPNDVEGWRFQDPGTGRPNDPPPRSTAQYDAICPPAPPTTTGTVPPSTTPPTTAASSGGGSASPSTSGGDGATTAGGTAIGTGGVGMSHPGAAPHGAATPSTTAATGTVGAPGPTVPDRRSGAAGPRPGTGPPSGSATAVATVTRPVPPGSGLAPVIVGALLVAGLAVAAWIRWRRRPGAP